MNGLAGPNFSYTHPSPRPGHPLPPTALTIPLDVEVSGPLLAELSVSLPLKLGRQKPESLRGLRRPARARFPRKTLGRSSLGAWS